VAGFWWLDGYHLTVRRYYQGLASARPYAYWVWANLALAVLCAGPAAAAVLGRAVPAALRDRPWRWKDRPQAVLRPVVILPLAACAAMVAADLSGLSKAEVERIWLPFAVWLPAGAALLPASTHRRWLAVQAATALAVNHLLSTTW
jgi:methylthioxylose transferase